MAPAEPAFESATIDHVALSVGDLDSIVAFYERLGLVVAARSDFAPAPIRSAVLRLPAGGALELVEHRNSAPAAPVAGVIEAAKRRGPFHFALRVEAVDAVVEPAIGAGGRLVSAPALNSRGEGTFAYLADPEGNLIEVVGA